MRLLSLATLVVATAGLSFPAAATAQSPGSYRLTGSSYAVYNLAGRVDVVAGDGSTATVDVRPQGKDASGLRVETGEVRGRSTLRVMYPGSELVYPKLGAGNSSSLRVHDDGTFGDGGSGGHTVRIRGDGSGTEASAAVTVHLPRGASLDIHLAVGDLIVRNVEGNLSLDVGAVTTDVDGVQGNLSLDSGSGPVKLARVRGDEISLDTGSGTIIGSAIAAREFSLDAGSGGVSVNGLAAERLSLDTGSGDISLALDSDVDRLSLDAGSGDVTIYAPPSLGAHLTADTGSGSLDVRLAMSDRHQDEDGVRGIIGDGRGEISIDAGSGDVRILPR